MPDDFAAPAPSGLPVGADRIAAGPTAEDIAAWERDGFLVVRGFFDATGSAEIERWTDALFAAPEVPGRHMVYYEDDRSRPGHRIVQRIENFCPFHPGFDHLVRHAALTRWISALMGGPAVLFKDKINFKLPGSDGFKAHQDQQAGWSTYAPLFVTAMVTIDPSTLANGCLELIAGQHRNGMVGEEWKPIDDDAFPLQPVETQAGDVIFFDSYVPHASKANQTDKPRRILYLTYNRASDGDHRAQYFADKRAAFPPDIERDGSKSYVFRV
ncbi:phytanoyl-CoA dioxygenase family protein [Zavarzinia sp. CC-PAN008]|uniref:phytanoyl-CoA dioxygenase family protein n=1 Tax=Zavarzinia sp. CC-PAN008 TaxID=3243332 RepID=UPI003F743082